jgi:hypothetical protein
MILRASPSAMAVLPTPGSPTNKRVIFIATAQNLNGPRDFFAAANQRINFAFAGFVVQIDTIGGQRLAIGWATFSSSIVVNALRHGALHYDREFWQPHAR